MIVGNPIIMILKAILNWFRLRRDYIANAVDKIPPEIKDALVAWYSPVKQKLSNYDVIESYIIDFTTFNNRDDAIINNNKFVFTGNVVVGINYERIQVEKYNSYKILIKGLTGGICYYYRNVDGVENYIIFNKDGVYDIPVSYKQGTEGIIMGYTCNSTTECTVTQLPTSILKDFSGNGNHAHLYGGKGNLNSGMGLYKVDFTSWRKSSVQTEVKPDVVKVTPNTSNYLFIQYASSAEIPSYKIKVIGLGDNVLKYQYATENGRKEINIVEGENELPTSIKVSNDYQIGYRLTPGTSVFTITQIPDYPD